MELTIYHSIFFFFLLLFLQFKRKEFTIVSFVVSVWFLSSILSVFFVKDWGPFNNLTLLPYIYLEVCFLISIYPVYKFDTYCINNIQIENPLILNYLLVFLAVISILPFIENLHHVISSYFYSNNDNLSDIYQNKMESDFNFDESIYWLDPVAKICNSIVLKFEPLNLLLLFYYFTRSKKNKLLLIGLLILVLNSVIFNLAMSGRVSTAFFILFFTFFMILFKKQISRRLFRNIVVLGGGTAVFLIILLIILTTARFENLEISPFMMINHYLGEGVVLFNDLMWNISQNTQGDNSFAFFKDLVGLDTFPNYLERRKYWNESRTGIDPIRFYTYIGDWFSDFGPIFTLLFILILAAIVRKLTYRKGQISFIGLYIFVSFFYIILCGFTIYPFTIYAATLNFIVGLLFSSLISFKFKLR